MDDMVAAFLAELGWAYVRPRQMLSAAIIVLKHAQYETRPDWRLGYPTTTGALERVGAFSDITATIEKFEFACALLSGEEEE